MTISTFSHYIHVLVNLNWNPHVMCIYYSKFVSVYEKDRGFK